MASGTEVSAPAHRSPYRSDIEGLRAVAVLAVLAYHFRLLGVSGGFVGVDVFFVISGFLITRGLIERSKGGGAVDFGDFYARRVRRILPLATLVIVVTLGAGLLLQNPLSFVHSSPADARAAATFVSNIRFARLGTDYLAEASAPSLFQQFWSLSVEEQFYLAMPLILALTIVLTKGTWRRRVPLAVFSVLSVASFAASVGMSVRQPIPAFFLIHSRAWELGVGVLVAMIVESGSRRAPKRRRARDVVALIGLAAIVVACFVFDASTRWPGYWAVVPVAGAALVIGAGHPAPGALVAKSLGSRLARLIGRYSFAIYLWHWPLAVFVNERGGSRAMILAALTAVAVASVASFHLIEQPIRTSRWLRRRPVVTLAFGATLIAGTLLLAALSLRAVGPLDAGRRVSATGDAAFAPRPPTEFVPSNLRPPLANGLSESDPNAERNVRCQRLGSCVIGDPRSRHRVVLFGDSHAGHWAPALGRIAASSGFRMDRVTRASCRSVRGTLNAGRTACDAWARAQARAIAGASPSVLVLSNAYSGAVPTRRSLTEGLQALRATMPRRTRIVVLGATPTAATNVPICLAAHLRRVRACEPAAELRDLAVTNERLRAAAERVGAGFVDLVPFVCTRSRCPAIVGDVLVYRDQEHLTTTFARSRAERLRLALALAARRPALFAVRR